MSDNIKNRLPDDGSGNSIQIANTFRTHDDAGTAIESPKVLATATNQLITVPNNAATITFYTDQQLKLGITAADVEGSGNGYTIIPVGIPIIKGIAGLATFHLRNDSGSSATIYFDFSMI